jgi:phage baseplate assembly protein W
MTRDDKCFGTDLQLLRHLDRQCDRDRGRDLQTTEGQDSTTDLARHEGVNNLKQALLLRFLTEAGELAQLGHPNYGSRLHELVGKPNNDANRNLAKLFVLQSLGAEPRVKEVKDVRVTARRRDEIQIDVQVVSIEDGSLLNLGFPFALQERAQS